MIMHASFLVILCNLGSRQWNCHAGQACVDIRVNKSTSNLALDLPKNRLLHISINRSRMLLVARC